MSSALTSALTMWGTVSELGRLELKPSGRQTAFAEYGHFGSVWSVRRSPTRDRRTRTSLSATHRALRAHRVACGAAPLDASLLFRRDGRSLAAVKVRERDAVEQVHVLDRASASSVFCHARFFISVAAELV